MVVQRGASPVLHTAGVADTATKAQIALDDSMRLASVAKAFSGATALSLVADGTLKLDDTSAPSCPTSRPRGATSRSASSCSTPAASPTSAVEGVPGRVRRVADRRAAPGCSSCRTSREDPLEFPPGTKYRYSNSDNIIVGLMVEAATGTSYEDDAGRRACTSRSGSPPRSSRPGSRCRRRRCTATSLDPPAAPEDVTELFAAGWTWASGGVVSTPADANRFVRGYASGATTNRGDPGPPVPVP